MGEVTPVRDGSGALLGHVQDPGDLGDPDQVGEIPGLRPAQKRFPHHRST
jgi:hypothetical protein